MPKMSTAAIASLRIMDHYFKSLIDVVASDLDDHFVGLGIDVTFTWA
jgi:hypothetical protein